MIDPRAPDYARTPVSPARPAFGYAPDPASEEGPVATVLTPFFNTGPVFHETAACVLGQSLQRLEWLIVNDGSSDEGALAVLAEYRPGGPRHDPRIRVVDHRVNQGLSAARNTGFRAARTPLVFMLDSDDLLEPTALEKCVWALEANPRAGFAKGWSVGFEGQEYLWTKGYDAGNEFLDHNQVTATAMIRRGVHESVGGFDETIRGGLEDWDFWMRCAERGVWGVTIPEFLDWYRRRPPTSEQHAAWENLKCEERGAEFRRYLRRRYPRLWDGGMPRESRPESKAFATVPTSLPFENRLARPAGHTGGGGGREAQRALLILPWLRMGGADRFNLDLVAHLARAGWGVTIATTLPGQEWASEFTRYTQDVFLLPNLGPASEFPRMLRTLIGSRRPDLVLLSNSELGYQFLPHLRATCPGPVYLDYCHMEEEGWNNGGHPRMGAAYQEQLDLSVVSSEHLKRWAASRGARPERTEVCRTSVHAERWRPDAGARARVRGELGVEGDTPVILYAARLCAQKQPMVFAETLRRLRDRGEAFVAVVAGDGEDRAALEAALDRFSLRDRVRMLGPVEAGRMPGLMSASDVFFLPSEWEGIALSIYEAMAAELAVVGAIVGGQPELVTEGCGVLLPRRPGDADGEAEAYARELESLLRDPERRRAMGRAARRRIVEAFAPDAMGARMVELFGHAARLKRDFPRPSLPPNIALEMATQAVELSRREEVSMTLWRELERTRVELARVSAPRAAPVAPPAWIEAKEALAYIERSRAFRLIRACKRTALYRVIARARFGPGWDLPEPATENPVARLGRITGSRSYRMISGMKRVPPYPWLARVRFGPGYEKGLPRLLRERSGPSEPRP